MPGVAQDFEYGRPSELRGLHALFIDVGTDIDLRNAVAEEIERELSGRLEILGSLEGAEIILTYEEDREDDSRIKRGTGLIFRLTTEGKLRLLKKINVRGSAAMAIARQTPAKQLARGLVAEYKKANALH